MEKLFKLTDRKGRTYGGTQWGEGISHVAPGTDELCGPGWIHAYTHPLLAALFNRIHANFDAPRLWEAEGVVGKINHGLKVGCTFLTTIREIPLPEVTTEQRVKFGILCALQVYRDPSFRRWAQDWLASKDRTEAAAQAAAEAIDLVVLAEEAIR